VPGAKLTSKGRVTIPKAIRDGLNLKPGVELRFSADPSGRIVITPLTLAIEDLIGTLPRPDKPLTIEEIDAVTGEAPVERAGRAL
jgi:AbrB family looped-hinge helix DNA binding protein